jgi:hypothetical protein
MNECKDPLRRTAFSELPPGIQELWKERLFNAVKLSRALLTADAVLTWAFLLWIVHTLLVVSCYAWSPQRFPAHIELAWSLGTFFGYYALIGFIRRQTQKYAITLRGEYADGTPMDDTQLVLERIYKEEDDPPLARFAFRLRDIFHLPRRSLGQSCIVFAQFGFGFLYVLNYVKGVLLTPVPDALNFPTDLWMFHLVITIGGCLILLKNAGFLIDVKKLLAVTESILGIAGKIPMPLSRKSKE